MVALTTFVGTAAGDTVVIAATLADRCGTGMPAAAAASCSAGVGGAAAILERRFGDDDGPAGAAAAGLVAATGAAGILSIAAKLLGATRVIACDIDLETARVVPFFQGSADAVRSGSFDVVVANINEDVIGDMYPDFERVAKVRILSGFQNESGEWTCVVR